ncbi:Ribosome biogenesis protein brx1 [Kappamyces sp. JEL0829]|nr:Ribosome biogenesis protein brx1 [Kappamyces sp. JEL0829]
MPKAVSKVSKKKDAEPAIKKKEFLVSASHDQDMDDEESQSDDEVGGRKALLKGLPTNSAAKSQEKHKHVKNKQRTLLISSRGVNYRFRHLMQDLHVLMPHSKKDAKIDSKSRLEDLNELAELNNCNNCVYFEMRKHQDMYLWISKTPNGPSAKFTVKNVHTMDELKMTGNCLKGSRPILSFDGVFDSEPYLVLLKELFTQAYAVPTTSRKIKPFIDHVMSFSVLDNKIWIRNFQIVESNEEPQDDTAPKKKNTSEPAITLVEIGPRFVLELMRIFDGSFGGSTLYENPHFVTANNVRRAIKGKAAIKHAQRQVGKAKRQEKVDGAVVEPNPVDKVFD